MKTTNERCTSRAAAWTRADALIPGDYTLDTLSSSRAGYPVHRSTLDRRAYICDLTDRLEVNLPDGSSVNLWIEESPAETISAALADLSPLSARVTVYVPATVGTADAADNAREVDAVASTLSAWFGGATIQPGSGCWMSDACGLVKEATTTVYAACTPEQLAAHIREILDLCRRLKAEMKQEAISLEISGVPGSSGLYFI